MLYQYQHVFVNKLVFSSKPTSSHNHHDEPSAPYSPPRTPPPSRASNRHHSVDPSPQSSLSPSSPYQTRPRSQRRHYVYSSLPFVPNNDIVDDDEGDGQNDIFDDGEDGRIQRKLLDRELRAP